ncbi:hypothetical protein PR048_033533 [Dryococelus australis]|uniref:Uncharacterized protein n=1 Tax=Dryococelus australis TaxID=614101 RepID=A0ABQ9G4P8_9NEOP|nr:hypothetical protein PR048_033533 [Dryococelus australis]
MRGSEPPCCYVTDRHLGCKWRVKTTDVGKKSVTENFVRCVDAPYSPRFTYIGSEDFVVTSSLNLYTLLKQNVFFPNPLSSGYKHRRGMRATESKGLNVYCREGGGRQHVPLPLWISMKLSTAADVPVAVNSIRQCYQPGGNAFRYITDSQTGEGGGGAAVAERLVCSPPTNAIRVQYPTESLRIFACGNRAGRCRWSAGFSRGSSVSPGLSFRHRSILTSITLIGSQDLAVKSRPNLFALSNCGRGRRKIPEKTRRPAASSSTIPTCENLGVTRFVLMGGEQFNHYTTAAFSTPRVFAREIPTPFPPPTMHKIPFVHARASAIMESPATFPATCSVSVDGKNCRGEGVPLIGGRGVEERRGASVKGEGARLRRGVTRVNRSSYRVGDPTIVRTQVMNNAVPPFTAHKLADALYQIAAVVPRDFGVAHLSLKVTRDAKLSALNHSPLRGPHVEFILEVGAV